MAAPDLHRLYDALNAAALGHDPHDTALRSLCLRLGMPPACNDERTWAADTVYGA